MRVYLDTSGVVKRYVEERGTEVLDRLYEAAEAGSVTASFSIWNIGEALGVLDRYHARGVTDEEEFRALLRSLTSETMKMIRLGSIHVLPITSRSLVESWALVLRHHLYEADALQISSAKEAGCDLLLGADDRLIQAAREEGIGAINVETEPEKAIEHISREA
ncbi:MAG: type II toxin-antitoxin system VapC family toxin [Candidatus Bathyarchaeota archaeon]|nr:type II toxin-antitoxin system VapC family toxin [Candidatus Bathyarchaeota archaeon]